MRYFIFSRICLSMFVAVSWMTLGHIESTLAETETVCPETRLTQLTIPPSPNSKPVSPFQRRLMPYDTNLALGIGYLRPASGITALNWLHQIRLPLFQNMKGEPFAWLIDGWLVDRSGSHEPFGIGGMIETDYELLSFIVYEMRSDGWLRFRYKREGLDDGTAWTHHCLLKLSESPLQVERWEERLMSDAISPLYFRSNVRHTLRAGPTTSSKRLKWISSNRDDYNLEPLEIRGDWMRVHLIEPSRYCASSKDIKSNTYEGWIKWRNEKKGSWLWYYTRGC